MENHLQVDGMFGCKKNMSRWLLIALLFVSMQLIAAEEESSVNKNFAQGISYFKQANYSSAVKKFELARQQGNRSTALYYNLGSAYYKLEQYKNAERYFSALIKQPKMKSLAEYNLGLIAVKQKDSLTAKKYFQSIVKTSRDKKVVYLASQQLSSLDSKSLPQKKLSSKKTRGSVYLSGSLGYDSNINFAPVDIGSEESGMFFDALLSADYLFSGKSTDGWSVEGLLYTIRYEDTGNPLIPKGAFDQDEYGVSLKKTQKLAGWNTHFKLGLDKLTYGARDYQSILKLEARGRHRLSNTDRVYLRYRYEDISSDDVVFDYTEGWRQKIRGEFRRYHKNNYFQLYYELELNDRNDLVRVDAVDGSISEFSYSPTRHTLRGKYNLKLNTKWDLTADLAYRKSDYPSTSTQNRNDDRWKAIASANYKLDKTMKLKLKLEYTDNASSDDLYVYDRQVVAVSLNKLF